jgi:hypothetical protein
MWYIIDKVDRLDTYRYYSIDLVISIHILFVFSIGMISHFLSTIKVSLS